MLRFLEELVAKDFLKSPLDYDDLIILGCCYGSIDCERLCPSLDLDFAL